MPVVLLTEDEEMAARLGSQQLEVFVLSMAKYLNMFWPNLTSATTAVAAIQAALANPAEEKTAGFSEYCRYCSVLPRAHIDKTPHFVMS